MVTEGYTTTLVAATLAISRSSLYCRTKPRGSRADRTYDEQIVVACGEKLSYGYRRVAWWLWRKKGLRVELQAGVTGVMRRTWTAGGMLAPSARKTEERVGPGVDAAEPNQIWQSDMTKIWAGASSGLGLLGECDRLLHAGDRGLESLTPLPNRRRVGGSRAKPYLNGCPRAAARRT